MWLTLSQSTESAQSLYKLSGTPLYMKHAVAPNVDEIPLRVPNLAGMICFRLSAPDLPPAFLLVSYLEKAR